jgi:hypothetical protein
MLTKAIISANQSLNAVTNQNNINLEGEGGVSRNPKKFMGWLAGIIFQGENVAKHYL